MSSRTSSGAFVHSRTNGSSKRWSWIRRWIRPRASAPSVPGRTWSHRSALFASPARLGSITSSVAPRAFAAVMSMPSVRKFPVGLAPQRTMPRLRGTSGIASDGVPNV